MNVNDFLKMCDGGMFKVVDATKTGYKNPSYQSILFEGDRNALRMYGYADKTLVGFNAIGKDRYELFVKIFE